MIPEKYLTRQIYAYVFQVSNLKPYLLCTVREYYTGTKMRILNNRYG